tara:strand:+ start:153 stop:281 length:129 start_codon:yes stop_codon:yes gene_type:complete
MLQALFLLLLVLAVVLMNKEAQFLCLLVLVHQLDPSPLTVAL